MINPFKRKPRTTYHWAPQADITTFELAENMKVLIPSQFRDDEATFALLSNGAKRHWKVVTA